MTNDERFEYKMEAMHEERLQNKPKSRWWTERMEEKKFLENTEMISRIGLIGMVSALWVVLLFAITIGLVRETFPQTSKEHPQ